MKTRIRSIEGELIEAAFERGLTIGQIVEIFDNKANGLYFNPDAGEYSSRFAKPKDAYCLSGRLYVSKSGWGLLSVPNDLVYGIFDAMDEPAIDLPPASDHGKLKLNAHISIFSEDEITAIGPDNLLERGHSFKYNIGPIKQVKPSGWGEMSKVWFIDVDSPELEDLRASYGLSRLPNNGKHRFHISAAVRKKSKQRRVLSRLAKSSDGTLEKIIEVLNDLPPLSPDYGYIFYNNKSKEVYIVSSDGDENEILRKYIGEIEKIPGIKSVSCESEYLPEHMGTMARAKLPWVKIERVRGEFAKSRFSREPLDISDCGHDESGLFDRGNVCGSLKGGPDSSDISLDPHPSPSEPPAKPPAKSSDPARDKRIAGKQADLEKFRKRGHKQIESFKKQQKSERKEMIKDQKSEWKDKQKEHKEEREIFRDDVKDERKELLATHKEERRDTERDLKKEHKEEHRDLKADHKEAIQDENDNHDAWQKLEEKLHDNAIDKAVARDEIEAERTKSIAALKADHAEEVAEMHSRHAEAIKDDIATSREQHHFERKQLASGQKEAYRDLKESHKAAISDLKEEHEEARELWRSQEKDERREFLDQLKSELAEQFGEKRKSNMGFGRASGKMDVDHRARNEEIDNFLEEYPDAKVVDVPITKSIRDKVMGHLDNWKRGGQDRELDKVKSIMATDSVPPPIFHFHKSGNVGIPDGFHRVAAYVLDGRKSIPSYTIGNSGNDKSRFAKAGDASDCGHERSGGGFSEGNECAGESGNQGGHNLDSKKYKRVTNNIFDRYVGFDEILGMVSSDTLSGVFPDFKPDVKLNNHSMEISFDNGDLKIEREISYDKNGDPFINNKSFYLDEKFSGKGLGIDVFADQVGSAIGSGAKKITCVAERGEKSNGYYTWPRFGYDGPIPPEIMDRFGDEIAEITGMDAGSDLKVSSLMRSEAGRDFWKNNGSTFKAEFDLSKGSFSRRILSAYLKEKGKDDPDSPDRFRYWGGFGWRIETNGRRESNSRRNSRSATNKPSKLRGSESRARTKDEREIARLRREDKPDPPSARWKHGHFKEGEEPISADDTEISKATVAKVLTRQHKNLKGNFSPDRMAEKWLTSDIYKLVKNVPLWAITPFRYHPPNDKSHSHGPLIVDYFHDGPDRERWGSFGSNNIFRIVDGKHRFWDMLRKGESTADCFVGDAILDDLFNYVKDFGPKRSVFVKALESFYSTGSKKGFKDISTFINAGMECGLSRDQVEEMVDRWRDDGVKFDLDMGEFEDKAQEKVTRLSGVLR